MTEELRCSGCGRAVDAGDRFCSACGASVAARPEELAARKRVTAVFVDLVGYTGLTEALDPEDARRLLDQYWRLVRGEIELHGGTVEKYIGDAVVGLFGAPHAHEDDPERAVRAALAVARRVRDADGLRVRVGVATGIALVDLAARPESGEALVVGDVATTAARLQQGAPAGGVLVDEPTHDLTSAVVSYRKVEPVAAKGRREAVVAWRALRLRPAGRRRSRAPRFVGRRHELTLLRAILARVDEEPAVGLVTVVGEPGIGKSRLVRELPWRGRRWEARVAPYGEGGAFTALADLVKEQAGIRERHGPAEASARLASFLSGLLPERGEAARVERHVRRLVGLDPVASAEGALESFAAWRRLFEGAAAHEPLVVVLEDVHWADDALLDFVEHLVEWAAPVPLTVLCTARPELLRRRPHWGGGAPNALTLTLAPLSDTETGLLVADVLGRTPAQPEQTALLARAGGNPLYAEQLARMLRERGELGAAVPETVHAVIAARLDTLAASTKRVLSDASVVGLAFTEGALTAIGGYAPGELEAALHLLERADLVDRRPDEAEWSFRHRLVREVAYGELPRTARVAKHVALAEWLEARPRPEELAEAIAHHYLRAREEAEASQLPATALTRRARSALVAAADRALGLSAFRAAVRLYGQALDLWPRDGADRALQLLRYARALWNAEVTGDAVALEARDGLLAAGDVDGAGEAEALLCEMHWYRGDRAAAAEHLDHAVELVSGRPDSAAKAHVISRLARSQMLAARHPEAIASGREALAMAERLGLVEVQAEALNSIGSARARSGDPDGIADVERAIELAGEARAAVVAYNNLSALLLEAGDRCGAEEAADRGRALAERLGDRLHLDWFEADTIGRSFGAGDWDDALAAAERWLASPRRPGYAAVGVLMSRCLVLHARGDPAALDDLARAETLARAAGDPQTLGPTLAAAAFVLVGEERGADARARAEEALSVCERAGGVPPLALFDLAVACRETGLAERLRHCLDAQAASSRWLELSRLCLDGEFERALELVPEPENEWVAAYLRLRSAERGGPGLEEALAYYRRVGATRYVARCEALLRTPAALATAR